MTIKPVNHQNRRAFLKLYRSAFPLMERKPLALLEWSQRRGCTDMLAIEADGFCGMVIVHRYGDLALIDFFAIDAHRRGGGLGAKALKTLCNMYADKRIFLEIEPPDPRADNAKQRSMREQFYLKNGFRNTDLHVKTFNVPLNVMVKDKELSFAEYRTFLSNVHGKVFCACMRPRLRK